MDRALAETRITGERLATTAAFLREVLAEPEFRAGRHDTGLLDRMKNRRQDHVRASGGVQS
jgi:acetyl-CoA carboxylase biotin carboxylase subunit